MAILEEGVCKIKYINTKGLGVGSSEQGGVEVPCVMEDELISFTRHKYRNRSNCVLTEVLEPNPQRQDPACPYFTRCGGCRLQHLKDQQYRQLKANMIKLELEKAAIQCTVHEAIFVEKSSRRRANFEAIKRDEKLYMGFHRFHSNQIVDIDVCPALLPELSSIIPALKELLGKLLVHKQKAQIFLTKAANGIDITFEIYKQGRLNEEQKQLLKEFAINNELIKVVFRARKFLEVIHLAQEPYVLFDGVKVQIDAHCFLQASASSDQILQDLVIGALSLDPEKTKNQKAVDLFCGRGTYTLPLSRYCDVEGVEVEPKSIAALKEACQLSGRQLGLIVRDLFTNPLKTADLNKYDFAVINPPRAGAEEQIHQLAYSNINTIVYISCNPETFIRDAKILLNGRYALAEVTPFDQFYWSGHLEVVGKFILR